MLKSNLRVANIFNHAHGHKKYREYLTASLFSRLLDWPMQSVKIAAAKCGYTLGDPVMPAEAQIFKAFTDPDIPDDEILELRECLKDILLADKQKIYHKDEWEIKSRERHGIH